MVPTRPPRIELWGSCELHNISRATVCVPTQGRVPTAPHSREKTMPKVCPHIVSAGVFAERDPRTPYLQQLGQLHDAVESLSTAALNALPLLAASQAPDPIHLRWEELDAARCELAAAARHMQAARAILASVCERDRRVVKAIARLGGGAE